MKTTITKSIISLIITLAFQLIITSTFAQAPQLMSYQAVIRDGSNALVVNKTVGMQISILQGTANGTAVYTETQTPTTNANGLVSISFGSGAGISSINWGAGTYFIETQTDPTGGTNYTITGTSQLLSVPYALYAKTAGNTVSTLTLMKDTLPMNLYIADDCSVIGIPVITVESPCVATPTVTDADGNSYPTVKIGTQVWMQTNLKTTKYNDGTTIQNVTNTNWDTLTTAAVCTYNNTTNADTINTYGRLYNWYAVNTAKLCPTGWHVPSDAEWTILSNYLGGQAGGRMKEKGTQHWRLPNTNATNDSKFTALPGGYRYFDGTFYDIGYNGYWWSSTESNTSYAFTRTLYYDGSYLYGYSSGKVSGFSVRCLRN